MYCLATETSCLPELSYASFVLCEQHGGPESQNKREFRDCTDCHISKVKVLQLELEIIPRFYGHFRLQ